METVAPELERLLDGFDFSVALLDADGEVCVTNDSWAEFGQFNGLQGPPDSVGQNYLETCDAATGDPFATAAAAGIRAVIEGDRDSFRLEYPCHSPDEKHWFLLYTGQVDVPGAAVIVAHLDITGRKVSEITVQRRNRELETLTSILSHDLRNPLSVAKGWADILEEGRDEHALEELQTALDRMEEIIEDALAFVKAGREIDDRTTADLRTLAESAWDSVATYEATLDVESTMTLRCVPGLLENVFENLFRNAIEHAGVDATVRVGTTDDGFYIEDDGPGIPPDERAGIFEFGHSERGGTGLGLAIVRTIVRAHGWAVDVETAESGGARFVARTRPELPANEAEEPPLDTE
ncbi:sensor histidine kinase [Natronomonas amylolytica]|uniref:sensor histidine kinase n=1 Tax=Natronomonas amylolytica TaxID=3108498 RepID=UPI003008BBA1